MSELLAARSQMALSLGFHIIFASVSIAMPFFMAVSHYLWLRGRGELYFHLTKAWSRGVAIFFATGAVSGTILSFELGVLWPEFMRHAGPIFGLPFSWEGTVFFLEAIALGLFLYGWDRLHPWVHWWCGVCVGITGILSSVLVICANGWMNAPTGFTWVDGHAVDVDPVAAMFNKASLWQGIHMVVAAFQATGFAVAGVHALLYLRDRRNLFHERALIIAVVFASFAALLQPLIGDFVAKNVASRQPEKLAAMEAHFETSSYAPLVIGGIPDEEKQKVEYGIEIPGMLSFLAFGDFSAEVKGLNEFPRSEWPPVPVVHFAFQIMVGIGSLLALVGCIALYGYFKNPSLLKSTWFLLVLGLSTPLGFIALEAGWVVTEVGRQPWIIYKVMKTADAITPMPGVVYSFALHACIYATLVLLVTYLMVRQVKYTTSRDYCYRYGG